MQTPARKLTFLASILLIAVVAASALADVVQSHYKTLRVSVPTKTHDGVSSVDTAVWTSPLNPQATRGNPTVTGLVEFSTASATCSIEVGLYFKNADGTYTFIGQSGAAQTITASASTAKDGSLFFGLTRPSFDTAAAPYYDLRVRAISAGTVTVRPWVFGADSKGVD